MKEFESFIEIILINNFNYSDKEMYSNSYDSQNWAPKGTQIDTQRGRGGGGGRGKAGVAHSLRTNSNSAFTFTSAF